MEFKYIIHPKSGAKISIYSKNGTKILHNYVKYLKKAGGIKKKKKK